MCTLYNCVLSVHVATPGIYVSVVEVAVLFALRKLIFLEKRCPLCASYVSFGIAVHCLFNWFILSLFVISVTIFARIFLSVVCSLCAVKYSTKRPRTTPSKSEPNADVCLNVLCKMINEIRIFDKHNQLACYICWCDCCDNNSLHVFSD